MAKKRTADTLEVDYQISRIKMDPKDLGVTVVFSEIIPRQTGPVIIDAKSKGNGVDEGEPDPAEDQDEPKNILSNTHTVVSQRRPHPDFIDAFKALRKFALDICEINVEGSVNDYTVTQVDIDGDVVMKQSRVRMTILKKVKRTDKLVKIGPTSQVTMYGDSDYPKADQMSKSIEVLIKEADAYLGGKYSKEEDSQLPLFSKQELQEA